MIRRRIVSIVATALVVFVFLVTVSRIGIDNLFYRLDSSATTGVEQSETASIEEEQVGQENDNTNSENSDRKSKGAQIELNDIDDQRSTLWPLLVSLIITMLGSLITTYIFLKEALDRTLDEKPYYRYAVQCYRESTMRGLWSYTLFSLALILVVVLLYGCLYFRHARSDECFRVFIYILYILSFVGCGAILHKCICVDAGIKTTTNQLLKEVSKKFEELSCMLGQRELLALRGELGLKNNEDVICWLQIEPESGLGESFEEKFISQFSAWEDLLMLLVGRDDNASNVQATKTQIQTSLEKCDVIFRTGEDDFEWQDAYENQWYGLTCDKLLRLKKILATNKKQFMAVFELLSDYRNLLKVKFDIEHYSSKNKKKSDPSKLENNSDLVNLFLYFCMIQSVYLFRIFPKIETFAPVSFFEAANFYGVRFENTSFRASRFQNVIFSRAKIQNSNFSISSFKRCEFFSSDSRDCSLSNAFFELCSFQRSNFVDVDFSGTVFKRCRLKNASFHGTILTNVSLIDPELEYNDIINSKLENVILEYQEGLPSFRRCNFSESSLSAIQLVIKTLPIARPLVNTSTVYQTFSFISKHNAFFLEGMKSTDVKRRLADLKKLVSSFSLEGKLFQSSKLASKRVGTDIFPQEPIWKFIKKLSVISMEECVFNHAVMPELLLYRVNMDQSLLKNAQMDDVCLACVYMPGSILNGANLREGILWASVLSSSVLDDGIMFKSICKLVNFEDASLRNLHASESTIEWCSFGQSDCTGVDLTRAKVSLSSFRDAILSAAELTGAEFKDVVFDNSVAEQMLSSYTLFANCDFINVSLKQSNFNYTTFNNCDFTLADFSNSVVTNVKFDHCNFKESNFRRTHFIRPIFKDCEYMDMDIFSECYFIYPQFLGSSKDFETRIREADGLITIVDEA